MSRRGRYQTITARFWTRGSGKRLRGSTAAQVVALYLSTSPHSNLIGLYRITLGTIAAETGCPIEGVSKALRRVSDAGFGHFDPDEELVWIPNHAREHVGEELKPGDKRRASVMAAVEDAGDHRFARDFWRLYGDAWRLGPDPFLAPPKPLPSPSEAPSKGDLARERTENREPRTEDPPCSPPPGDVPPPSLDGSLETDGERMDALARSALLQGYSRRYEAATSDAWMGASGAHRPLGVCSSWCAHGCEGDEGRMRARVDALLDGMFADEWMTTKRWPWPAAAKDPARYANGAGNGQIGMSECAPPEEFGPFDVDAYRVETEQRIEKAKREGTM